MALHIAALIIVNWLLTVAWFDPSRDEFILFAGMFILIWWIAWYNREPPWPSNDMGRSYFYVIFLGTTVLMTMFIRTTQAALIPLEIILLWVLEIVLHRRKAKAEKPSPTEGRYL